jgi:VCBS repeat-containing protein
MANHAVVITSTAAQASGSVIERTGLTGDLSLDLASGVITFTDADLTDTHRVVSIVPQGAGYIGALTLGALADSTGGVTGSIPWIFSVPDNALDFLAAGQSLVQSYAVTIGDFHNGPVTQIVTVTLAGSNDTTVIDATTTASGSVVEQAGVTGGGAVDSISGKIAFTDADLTDTHKVVSVVSQGAGYVGTLTLGAIADSTGGVTGSIPWTFSVSDNALDFLAAGQTIVQKYTVTIGDFHNGPASQVVTVTLTGANDVPVVTSTVTAATGLVSEVAGATGSAGLDLANGTLTFKDTDLTDTHTATAVAQGTGFVGNFSVAVVTDSTGGATGGVGWHFAAADGALDFLAAGQTLVQSYNVTVTDNHGGSVVQGVTVTLTGTNDRPVITSTVAAATGAVTELTGAAGSAALDTASGTLTFKDIDLADTHTATITAQGPNYLGSLSLAPLTDSTGGATGSVGWSFSVADGALDYLAAGQRLVQKYNVTIADTHGGTATQGVTVTLTGANDATAIAATATTASGSVTERAGLTGSTTTDLASGSIAFKDADLTDTHQVVSVVPQGTGYLGSFTLGALTDSTGGGTGFIPWTFSVRDGALDFLSVGQTVVQRYAVTIGDLHNGPATQIVTVTLTGTNDPTVVLAAATTASGSITEQAGLTGSLVLNKTTGVIAFTDADIADKHLVASVVPQGTGYLGTLTFGAVSDSTGGVAGSVPWTFSVPDGALDFLAAGQMLVQSYTVKLGDFHGGQATQVVTVTLTGANDPTVIVAVQTTASAAVSEQTGTTGSVLADTASGTIAFKDLDLADTHSVSVTPQGIGYVGSFTLGTLADSTNGATGSMTWNFSVPDGALDFLAGGQTLIQKYNVTVDDGHGGAAVQVVTVTLTGTNDAPTITSTVAAATGSVIELAGATGSAATDLASGTLTFADVDLSDTHTASAVAQGAGYLGSFTLGPVSDGTGGATGSVVWNFSVPDGALDFLAAGQTLIQKYDVTVDDRHGGTASQVVTVTLTGTNDVPIITSTVSPAAGAVNELAGVTGSTSTDLATGSITFMDVDLTDVHSAGVTPQGLHYIGTLTLGPVSDSTGGATGSVGWTFSVIEGALDFLAAGQTLVQKYNVTLDDGHGGTAVQVVTVTLTGTNDAPVCHAITTDVIVPGTVTLAASFTDPDASDSHTFAIDTTGTSGLVTNNGDGTFSYDPNGKFVSLAAGETAVDHFNYSVDDGHGGVASATATVTVHGHNDAPVITSGLAQATSSVTEQAGVTASTVTDLASGTIAFTDANLSDTHTVTVVEQGAGYVGTLTLGPISDSTGGITGSVGWTFSVVDGALDFLAAGQTLLQKYDVTVADHNGGAAVQVVTVTITGTNDVAVIGGVSTGAVTEDVAVTAGNLTASGALTITDADLGQSSFVAQGAAAGTFGTFTLDTAGHWTYTASNAQTAIQQLGAGQSLTDSFTAVSLDGSKTQLVTVTITGTNDVPVIGGISTGAVTEDVAVTAGNFTAGGALTITDADLGQSSFVAQAATAGSSGLGTFTLDTAGHWTYTASNAQTAIQQLGAGQTLTDSFTAVSLDGSKTQLVTVTITGTNDVPVIGGVSTGAVTEDVAVIAGNLATSGTLTITDVDLGQSSFVAQGAAAGTFGTFTLDTAGHWTYTASNAQTAMQQLGAGQTLTDSFTAISFDGTKTQLVTVTITGTNDVPVIGGISTGAVTEDVGVVASNLVASGTLTITDTDLGQSSFVAQGAAAGTFGTFSLDTAGHWTYTANNPQTAIQQLAAGQTLTESFTAVSLDGSKTQLVTVTINGTNDVPVITSTAAQATGAITERAGVTGSTATDLATGTLSFTDIDRADTHSVTATAQGTGYVGSLTLGAVSDSTGGGTGSVGWTFSVVDGALDFLAAGQTLVQKYNVTVSDHNGGTAVQVVTVTLTGTNDTPVAQAITASVNEHGPAVILPANFTDPDAADALTTTFGISTVGTLGLVTENGDGTFTYDPNGQFAALSAGQTATDHFTYTVDDGNGGITTQTATITIIGQNDTPVITSPAAQADASIIEQVGVTGGTTPHLATGTLTFTDAESADTHTVSVAPQAPGYVGSFTLGTLTGGTGGVPGSVTWNFLVPDGALDFLAAGETKVQGYNVTIADNHGGSVVQVVTLTLTGTNDAPVAHAIAATASDPGAVAVLTANYTDPDTTDTHRFTVDTTGTVGTVISNGDGTFSYDANNRFSFQPVGTTVTDSFSYTVSDTHGGTSISTATVTVTVANRTPVISASLTTATGSIAEQAGVSGVATADATAGTIAFSDANGADTHTASVAPQGAGYLGTFTVGTLSDSTGGVIGSVGWNFSVPDSALDFLAAGQARIQNYDVTITDSNGGTVKQTVAVTLTGTNDAPASDATTNAQGFITEQLGVVGSPTLDIASGAVTFTDVDLTDTHTTTVTAQGSGYVGTLTLRALTDSTGGTIGSVPWTFSVADSALDFLAAGQTLIQNYNVTVADNHGGTVVQVVTVTLTGTNDAPIAQAISASVNEHGPAVTLAASFTDLDIADSHVFSVDTPATLGLVSSNGDGTFTYDPNGQFASLAAGQTATDHFVYIVDDLNGGVATQTATVTIVGQNDAPVANPDILTPAQAQGNLWTALLANDRDIDTAHNLLTITSVSTVGTFGTVSLNPVTHSLTYTAPAVAGPDTFQYTISDGLGGTSSATVTVNPDHLVTDNWIVSTGQVATFSAASVLANDSAFNGGALTLFSASGPNVVWDGTNITYTAPAAGSDSFTYTTTDSVGRHATGTVNVSIWDGSSTPVGDAANQAEWLVASGGAPVTMIGTAGADHLTGGTGSDVIIGGGGADILTGGTSTSDHFVYGEIGTNTGNRDSSFAAMDRITDFSHGGGAAPQDIIELNGFGFAAANIAAITNTTLGVGGAFTSANVIGYFADGNAIHSEKLTVGTGNAQTRSEQIYIDVNHNGNFDVASDMVIHLDNFGNGLTTADFQFH